MNSKRPHKKFVGRAAVFSPANRFEKIQLIEDEQQLEREPLEEHDENNSFRHTITTEIFPDRSQTIIVKNNSPDIPFRYSINPYRGCEHGCAYCYARPSHELLGMNAGLDFESKIMVKYDAARLLREELNQSSWPADVIAISGVTDCYQPIERKLKITRSLLEVMLEAHQGVSIITKNVLVLRDLDLLRQLAKKNLVHLLISLTTLDGELARTMKPRTASPEARLRAIRTLSDEGVPVCVMIAPAILGLNDQEIPKLLQAAQEAGAHAAGYQLLRLPRSVAPIFIEWLQATFPLKKDRVEALIRGTRAGELSDSQFGRRMTGQGNYAAGMRNTFHVFRNKFGLQSRLPELDLSQFRPPRLPGKQIRLF